MKKYIFILIFFAGSCNSKNLKFVADLPRVLEEVSGTQMVENYDSFWMVNDAGNDALLFELNSKGKILKTIRINAENEDWEELTSDKDGNLYIGDFGNNKNKRKDLSVLIVKNNDLGSKDPIDVEKITFSYPDQKKFPPKKKNFNFDCEAFFFLNDSLYLFTKSRVENKNGNTNMYKIPAKPGDYIAEKMDSYQSSCNQITCWVTSADISPDKSKVALLTPGAVLIFSDFTGSNFFNGKVTEYKFDYISQKESLFFKDNETIYITDEYAYGIGGNLYEFKLH